jgi:hypothetical protein
MHALCLAAFQVTCQRMRGENADQPKDRSGTTKTSKKLNTQISLKTHALYPGLLWFQDLSSARAGKY